MKRNLFVSAILFLSLSQSASAQRTLVKYLSGTDKDHTVPWEFFCTEGANSGKWTTIPVPSNWELQGFGGYNYGHEKNKHHEHGLYKYHFKADKDWQNKNIELVFEGVMTDAEVKVNGQSVGPVHQGSFYRFTYDIASLLKPGADNLLEVDVSKMSADSTVNKAERESDFWVFGGIYRPVYLAITPSTHIDRIAIDAKADGKFSADIFSKGVLAGDKINVLITPVHEKPGITANSLTLTITKGSDSNHIETQIDNPGVWSPEFPTLYTAQVTIYRNKTGLHTIRQRFGFRTVEVRSGDGIYVNNKKIRFKGVNRHSFWPESGRTLSRDIHLLDIGLIKDMNMNAVRMSHYPPDPEFLDLCDSLGLFVLDELTGWQKKYGTPVGRKLVKELVLRDVNHPSVIFWDNGNEGGFNTDLDNDYALYDPQKRTVLHPWELFNHVDTKHYPDYTYVEKAADKGNILMHTEMIHGLYDGGHGAGLEDYWNLMLKNPRHAGGFLWALFDEGVVRKDRNDSIDTYGNNAPDGIVGPHREKEGSYYTIKKLWSPVQAMPPVFDKNFNANITIENRYDFTDLSGCKFNWEVIKYPGSGSSPAGHKIVSSGTNRMTLAPGLTGTLSLNLPALWQKRSDALRLIVTDNNDHEIVSWTWPIKTPSEITMNDLAVFANAHDLQPDVSAFVEETKPGNIYSVKQYHSAEYDFDSTTGLLQSIGALRNNKTLPVNGPVLAGNKLSLQSFYHHRYADSIVIDILYTGKDSLWVKWIFGRFNPPRLEYQYTQKDTVNFSGITFNIDENTLTGIKYLGDGPYRVWKNRLNGPQFDVWEKKYNNTITGETFDYPEFPGYYANLNWVMIQNTVQPLTIFTGDPGIYLQLLHPAKQKTKFIPHVNPPFPEGNLGFLHSIAPIGTKFREAASMGPQSQRNLPVAGRISGTLWFVIEEWW